MDLYLRNALIVTETDTISGGLLIDSGKIKAILPGSPEVQANQILDVQGKVIMPGIVDCHVHLNEPGRTEWEGYLTGTAAAAAGGVTTVLDMPLNCVPYTVNREALLAKKEAVAGEAVVDYAFWGGLVDDNLSDLAGLSEEGVVGFKAFMSESGVDFKYIQDDLLFAGLEWMKANHALLGVHAINESVSHYRIKKLMEAGRIDRAAWLEAFPPECELEAILRAIHWARVTGGQLHVVHVSIASGIRAIAAARAEGVQVTGETCPHYLFFDQEDYIRMGPAAKCVPPIRSREEVDALWRCVLDGSVDIIASDHSPCTWSEKEKGLQNIWQAWGGISGIQTMLPLLLTEGYHKRGLPLPTLVRLLASNPARRFGIYPQKGALLPGSDADLVLIDLHEPWVLQTEDLLYRNPFSAYVGCSFIGKVERTILRGTTVYEKGEIKVQPGYGRLWSRFPSPDTGMNLSE